MLMDVTRMTQNGMWSGRIHKDGQEIALDGKTIMGTRDRSWGIRPIGAAEPQPPIGGNLAQFYWLWAPCNFDNQACFAHTNDDAAGEPWNRRSVIAPLAGEMHEADNQAVLVEYRSGTRRITRAEFSLGKSRSLTVTPAELVFYMSGLGYTHPEWGHGMDHGGDDVAYDSIDLTTLDDNNPANLHIQALSKVILTDGGEEHSGIGVLEQNADRAACTQRLFRILGYGQMIPVRPEDMTNDWIEQKMGAPAGSLGKTSFAPVGTGQMCDSFRLTLEWNSFAGPATIIAKCPSMDEASRNIAAMVGNYKLEVSWYKDLAVETGINCPQCYHTEIADNQVDFALLIDDRAPAKQGDQIAGADDAAVAEAIREMAILHAGPLEHANRRAL